MAVSELEVFQDPGRSNWVRLRTLVILRWVAITGQIAALVAGVYWFDLEVETGLVSMTIGASVLANLFSTFLFEENRRLREREALLILLFDLLQLGLLLYLTGGLNNPFALLILAPVTIAATFLQMRSTLLMGLIAIALIGLLSRNHLELHTVSGEVLSLPPTFLFGFWIALMIGVVFLSLYARQVTVEMHNMGDALLATQMALAREQKLTDLGGVVAAAAHELGTPLATIKLVSSELVSELADQDDLRDDAILINEQADRCRDILRSMGRSGKDDLHMRRAPLETVVREAAEPHSDRGKRVDITVAAEIDQPQRQPVIERRPEVVHGLRNLIQNAVDFSNSRVVIEAAWTESTIRLRIADDGPGYPASVIGRIGTPFVRRRSHAEDTAKRPEYEGMGLGLFISKTLLERSGARLTFSNGGAELVGRGDVGALVMVEWDRNKIDPPSSGGLGENKPIT
jgi:two-component system sensor histidine kinase RegB